MYDYVTTFILLALFSSFSLHSSYALSASGP